MQPLTTEDVTQGLDSAIERWDKVNRREERIEIFRDFSLLFLTNSIGFLVFFLSFWILSKI